MRCSLRSVDLTLTLNEGSAAYTNKSETVFLSQALKGMSRTQASPVQLYPAVDLRATYSKERLKCLIALFWDILPTPCGNITVCVYACLRLFGGLVSAQQDSHEPRGFGLPFQRKFTHTYSQAHSHMLLPRLIDVQRGLPRLARTDGRNKPVQNKVKLEQNDCTSAAAALCLPGRWSSASGVDGTHD